MQVMNLNTNPIAEELNSRAVIDAQQTQVISANAALAERKSDLRRVIHLTANERRN